MPLIGDLGIFCDLYSLAKFRAIFRIIFRFCCTFISHTFVLSSAKCTSKSQCILSTAHSKRACFNKSSALKSALDM